MEIRLFLFDSQPDGSGWFCDCWTKLQWCGRLWYGLQGSAPHPYGSGWGLYRYRRACNSLPQWIESQIRPSGCKYQLWRFPDGQGRNPKDHKGPEQTFADCPECWILRGFGPAPRLSGDAEVIETVFFAYAHTSFNSQQNVQCIELRYIGHFFWKDNPSCLYWFHLVPHPLKWSRWFHGIQ